MVGPDGALPLPWLAGPLAEALRTQHGHALLVHGPQGIGQFELALSLAQSWLCEARGADAACGRCAACHLVQARAHPDLLVLVPEALAEALHHHLRHVRSGHHRLHQRPLEAFPARPFRVGMYGIRSDARIAVDLALSDGLGEDRQLVADLRRPSGWWFHDALPTSA